ncbi:MAG TPA: hypothetical protein VD907_05935 [Verrucomicrobiae bacterium]|nr:hypothetical protein [Verrucomicrobiae bacterium]
MKRLASIRLVLFGILFLAAASLLTQSSASAAGSTAGFKAGRIIDDSTFTNANSMSAAQIQHFLNSKVPHCDTNGTQPSEYGGGTRAQYGRSRGNPPPFICLKDYRESTKSAAQIIKEVAVQYQINPQVLIVLLQKEQGLITDSWPWKVQYRSATGYGCPDTAPCDREYYGFSNQVRWAAKMFRAIMNDDPNWYVRYTVGSNRIYYNPNAACGSSMVNIENRATAALYNYTPYQPNRSALAAGYGQGDSCGAYGNRNFYLYFKDWFGATTGSDTPFFTVAGRGGIYITGASNTYYYLVNNNQLKDYGYGSLFGRIKSISPQAFAGLTPKGALPDIARFEGDEIYAISQSGKHKFSSAAQYAQYGFRMGQEASLPKELASWYAARSEMQNVLRQHDRPEVFFVQDGKKRHISSRQAFETLGSPAYVSRASVTLSSRFATALSTGAPILTASTLVAATDTAAYHWWNGTGRQAIAPKIIHEAEKPVDYAAPAKIVDQLPAAATAPIDNYVRDAAGKYYLLSGKYKIHLSPADVTKLGVAGSNYKLSDDVFLAAFTNVVPTNKPIRINKSSKIYLYVDGAFRHVYSQADLASYGFRTGDAINLTTEVTKLYTVSEQPLLAEGSLIRSNRAPEVYLINNGKKHHVTSVAQLKNFGKTMGDVRSVTPEAANAYPTSSPLAYWLKDTSGAVWFIQNGKRYSVSAPMLLPERYAVATTHLTAIADSTLTKLAIAGQLDQFVRSHGDKKVYVIEHGKKRHVESWAALRKHYGDDKIARILDVSADFVQPIPTGTPVR